MSEEEYIGIVGEIFDGYTEIDYFGKSLYLKHFSIRDQRYIHLFYQKYKSIAVKKGIPLEEEMLLQLEKDGLWSKKDEELIVKTREELDSLISTQKKLILPSQKNKLNGEISSKRTELYKMLETKRNVVGKTAEDYGTIRANQEFIRYIVYKDKDLKHQYFSDADFAELSDEEIHPLVIQSDECSKRLNDLNIQHAVLRDFFNMYMSQTENVSAFYGKPIVELSVYQLKLAIYARVFFNIFQYNDDIPERIKKDPEAIFNFSEAKKNKDAGPAIDKTANATAVFGATKDDLEIIDPNAKNIQLSEILKEKGGSMNMEQLMELMG